MNTMPVEGGAGRMRIETGTPLCNPTPLASTGRWMVVSKRTAASSGGQPDPSLVLIQGSIVLVTNPSRYPFDSQRFVKLSLLQKCNTSNHVLWQNNVNLASFLRTAPKRARYPDLWMPKVP